MFYLIVGAIITLASIGLMRTNMGNEISYLGMFLFIIGLYTIFKGRRKIDKK